MFSLFNTKTYYICVGLSGLMMSSYQDCITILDKLRAKGICIFLDDFGTGYSSLSHLKRLPIDKVKIDLSFVRDILVDKSDAALVDAIIAMTKSLGLQTIAEGIECEAQGQYLLAQGCTLGQGYYFSKPMPADEFLTFLSDNK